MNFILRVVLTSYLMSYLSTSKIKRTRHFITLFLLLIYLLFLLLTYLIFLLELFCNAQQYNQTGMSWPTGS